MSLLRSIESRIAHLVEGTFGKVFRTSVQPVELARRLVKEMDDNQQRTVRKIYVPNSYDVYLSPADHAQFSDYQAALTAELSEYLAEHARRTGYALMSRPRVTLHVDEDLDLGAFGIGTRMEGEPSSEPDAPAPQLDPAPSQTMIYRPEPTPEPAPLPALGGSFEVVGPDGTTALSGDRVSAGRGKVNDLVVHDSSVSREHAEFVRAADGWLVRDLDSTNGVMVNGSRVREQQLAPGDRILLGNAQLRFEHVPGGGDDGDEAAGS